MRSDMSDFAEAVQHVCLPSAGSTIWKRHGPWKDSGSDDWFTTGLRQKMYLPLC